MVKYTFSCWGVKDTGEDITPEIMRIINSAKQFIIVCGYNFTFRTSAGARPFFDAIKAKASGGVHVLFIFPPKLHGRYNPQPAIIHYCITNNLPVILNHQNHSKWLLTDEDLYYGSSNFTKASWEKRVEVLSIHEHTQILQSWSQVTIKDFKQFLDKEITDLTRPARRMRTYRGLLTSTRNAWRSIKPLVLKLNPSIEKVIETLQNYDDIASIINTEVVNWFDFYEKKDFELIFNLSSDIMDAIDHLCEYAYCNIYNETVYTENVDLSDEVVKEYNRLYAEVNIVIDKSIEELPDEVRGNNSKSEFSYINLSNINSIKQKIDEIL